MCSRRIQLPSYTPHTMSRPLGVLKYSPEEMYKVSDRNLLLDTDYNEAPMASFSEIQTKIPHLYTSI